MFLESSPHLRGECLGAKIYGTAGKYLYAAKIRHGVADKLIFDLDSF